jgi:CopG family transcriptional regulator, nickel-responsive regulator
MHEGAKMQRVTISMSDALAEALDTFMAETGYTNRSEAVRDLARLGLERASEAKAGPAKCLATLSYVYDHEVREIPRRLTQSFHHHHDLSVATLHVHLDHENCLEVAVLRGDRGTIREFAQAVVAERGVRHGQVSFIPIDIEAAEHRHQPGEPAGTHTHIHPKE